MSSALIRILLVDDDEDDVALTLHALKASKLGNEVTVARDGLEALDALRHKPPFEDTHRPDLILLDLNMPRMDGREFLEQLRAEPECHTIPVVVLTTSEADEDIYKAYDLGANCFITKPVDLDKFKKVVETVEEFWFGIVRLPRQ